MSTRLNGYNYDQIMISFIKKGLAKLKSLLFAEDFNSMNNSNLLNDDAVSPIASTDVPLLYDYCSSSYLCEISTKADKPAQFYVSNVSGYSAINDLSTRPGELVVVKTSPTIESEFTETELNNICIDYPSISTTEAVNAFKLLAESCPIWNRPALNALHVRKDDLRFCYRIEIDSQFEYRSLSWETRRLNSCFTPIPTLDDYSLEKPWDVAFGEMTPFEERSEEKIINNTEEIAMCWKCGNGQPAVNSVSKFNKMIHDEDMNRSDPDPNCNICGGKGYVKKYLKVRCDHQTGTFSRMVNEADLPTDELNMMKGELAFKIKGEKFVVRDAFLDENLNASIVDLLNEIEEWSGEYDVVTQQQALFLSVVPVRLLEIEIGSRIYHCTVFDSDHKIVCKELSQPKWLKTISSFVNKKSSII